MQCYQNFSGLFTLTVFARNLLRGNRRINIFSYLIFDDWRGIRTQAFESNKTTQYTLFGSNRSVISRSPDTNSPAKFHLFTYNYGNYAIIMIKLNIDQFCILRNPGVKFGKNQITFDTSHHIKSSLKIHVYAYKWFKTCIVMKFVINGNFVNLNHSTKFC